MWIEMDIDNTSVACLSSEFPLWIKIATSVIPLTSNFSPSHFLVFPSEKYSNPIIERVVIPVEK